MRQAKLTPKTMREVMRRMGRKGGLVGGKKRMASMTSEQRRQFALEGVRARREKRERTERNRALRRERITAARAQGRHTRAEWDALVAEFGGRCVRCGNKSARLQRDHIIPIYQGGSDAISNIQPLCPKCNCAKGSEATDWAAIRRKKGFD